MRAINAVYMIVSQGFDKSLHDRLIQKAKESGIQGEQANLSNIGLVMESSGGMMYF